MSHPYRPSGEFLALLNAFCGGDLDAKQAEQLEEIICDNADAREFFIDYTTVHAGLCDISMSDLVPDATTADAVAIETPLAPLSPTADDASSLCSSPTLTFPWGIPGRTLAVLCLLWLVTIAVPWALAICFFAKDADRGPWPAGRVFAEEPPGGIARLTECVDAVWAHTATDPALGSSFNEGDRLVLVEGFVEIACNGGARILMEGPATVQLPSANRIHLHRGRLNIVVPDETEDFTIETDRLSVTQRGAESGIMLDSSGTIETHVLRGTVEVRRIENGRTADLRENESPSYFLKAGQGVRLEKQKTNLELISTQQSTLATNTARNGVFWLRSGAGFVKGGPIGGTTVLESEGDILTMKPTVPGHALIYDLGFSTKAGSYRVERRQLCRTGKTEDLRSGILGYAVPGQGALGAWINQDNRVGYGAFHDRNGVRGGDSRIDEWQSWRGNCFTAEKQIAGDGVSALDGGGPIRMELDIDDTGNNKTSRFRYTFEQHGNRWELSVTFEQLRKAAEEDAPGEGGRFVDSLIAKGRNPAEDVSYAYYAFAHGDNGATGNGTVKWKNEHRTLTVTGAN